MNATSSAVKFSVTERKRFYEHVYRKSKDGMYAATDLVARGGLLGWLGMAIYKMIWATMLTIFCTIWLLTLGGKFIKETNENKESK